MYPHWIDDFAVKTIDMLFHLSRLAPLYHNSGGVGFISWDVKDKVSKVDGIYRLMV